MRLSNRLRAQAIKILLPAHTTLRPTDIAWLAGVVDSKGYFTVQHQKRYRKVRGYGKARYLHLYNNPVFLLVMVDEEIVARVAKLINVSFSGPLQHPVDLRHKPLFEIRFTGLKASVLGDFLYPHMGTRQRRCIDKMRMTTQEKWTLIDPNFPGAPPT